MKKNILFGMGNPLLDISANVGLDYIKKYKLKVGESIMCEDFHKPLYKEMVEKFDVSYSAGGASQNVFRAFQWMIQSPQSSTFVGCIGEDDFGKQLKTQIESDDVKSCYLVTKEKPTGTCASLLVDKERTLVANLSAAECYKKEHFHSEEIQKYMKSAEMYYFSGFFITVAADCMLEVAEHAVKENKIFALNLSAEFVINFFNEPLMKLLEKANYIFGNETEAKCFSKKMGWDLTEVPDIAKKTAEHFKFDKNRPKTIVFTQGKLPACIAIQTEKGIVQKKFDVAQSNKVVDTNGAGDSFVGGFLSQLAQKKDIETCVKAGMYVSKIIVETSGIVFPKEKPTFK